MLTYVRTSLHFLASYSAESLHFLALVWWKWHFSMLFVNNMDYIYPLNIISSVFIYLMRLAANFFYDYFTGLSAETYLVSYNITQLSVCPSVMLLWITTEYYKNHDDNILLIFVIYMILNLPRVVFSFRTIVTNFVLTTDISWWFFALSP